MLADGIAAQKRLADRIKTVQKSVAMSFRNSKVESRIDRFCRQLPGEHEV